MFLLLRSPCSSLLRPKLFELSSFKGPFPPKPIPLATMPPKRGGQAGGAAKSATATTTTTTTTDKNPAAAAETRPRRATKTPDADTTAAKTTKTTKTTATKGPTRDRESRLWSKGHTHVAGVDEAGRGPLAGPVVAAACVLPADAHFPGLDDSKVLDEPAREALYAAITSHPGVAWCVRVEDHTSIDRINILQATMRAMRRAVAGLEQRDDEDDDDGGENNNKENAATADAAAIPDPRARRSTLRLKADYALIDGNRVPQGLPCAAEAVVGGDGKVSAIAAASVLAKVTRDRIMLDLEEQYPGYGLGQHKGYGVPQHVAALRRLGPCAVHRRSFQPTREMTGWSREAMLAAEEEAKAAKVVYKKKDDGRGNKGDQQQEDGEAEAAGGKAAPRGAAAAAKKKRAASSGGGVQKGPAKKRAAAAAGK
jgi:ribonuclease HII